MLLDGTTLFKPNTVFRFYQGSRYPVLRPICDIKRLLHGVHLHQIALVQEEV